MRRLLAPVGQFVGRVGAWLDALVCPHEETRLRAADRRLWLECLRCGWQSHGWFLERER